MIVWNRVDKTFIWLRSRFLYLYFGTKCLLYQLTKGLNNINVVRYSQLAHWAALKVNLLLLKLIHLFAREVLLVKKLEIEETKTTWYSNFKTDIIEVGLVFLISNFFITKMSLANKWLRKKILSALLLLIAWYLRSLGKIRFLILLGFFSKKRFYELSRLLYWSMN